MYLSRAGQQTTTGSNMVAVSAATGQQILQAQWQFATAAAAKTPNDKLSAATTLDPTQCYMQYTSAAGTTDDQSGGAVAAAGGGGVKRKVNMYSSLSVPTVSFVTGMTQVRS